MSLPYTAEMMESVKKVEASRAARIGFEPRRMTADEKTALLEAFHPDTISIVLMKLKLVQMPDKKLQRN